jgi:hypothetical protein
MVSIMNGDGSTTGLTGISAALGDAEAGTGFFGESKLAAENWEKAYEGIMSEAGVDVAGVGETAGTVLGPDGTQQTFKDFSAAV